MTHTGPGEQAQQGLCPQGREPIEIDSGAVKMIAQLVVETRLQVQGPNDAGHPGQLRAYRQTGDGCRKPQKSSRAREGRTQGPDGVPP